MICVCDVGRRIRLVNPNSPPTVLVLLRPFLPVPPPPLPPSRALSRFLLCLCFKAEKECSLPEPSIPMQQHLPTQEPGIRVGLASPLMSSPLFSSPLSLFSFPLLSSPLLSSPLLFLLSSPLLFSPSSLLMSPVLLFSLLLSPLLPSFPFSPLLYPFLSSSLICVCMMYAVETCVRMSGTQPSRALPYELRATGGVKGEDFFLEIYNTGAGSLGFVCVYVREFVDADVDVCVWMYMDMDVDVHTYIDAQPSINTYTHIHTYTHTHIHIYTRTHIHTYTHTHIQHTNIRT